MNNDYYPLTAPLVYFTVGNTGGPHWELDGHVFSQENGYHIEYVGPTEHATYPPLYQDPLLVFYILGFVSAVLVITMFTFGSALLRGISVH